MDIAFTCNTFTSRRKFAVWRKTLIGGGGGISTNFSSLSVLSDSLQLTSTAVCSLESEAFSLLSAIIVEETFWLWSIELWVFETGTSGSSLLSLPLRERWSFTEEKWTRRQFYHPSVSKRIKVGTHGAWIPEGRSQGQFSSCLLCKMFVAALKTLSPRLKLIWFFNTFPQLLPGIFLILRISFSQFYKVSNLYVSKTWFLRMKLDIDKTTRAILSNFKDCFRKEQNGMGDVFGRSDTQPFPGRISLLDE